MRILALAILAIGTVSIGPAAAQTYEPAYPVCLHVYGLGANYYECRYTSLAQCNARRHRAVPLNVTSIHILRVRDRLRAGIIAASTKHREMKGPRQALVKPDGAKVKSEKGRHGAPTGSYHQAGVEQSPHLMIC